MDRPPPTCARHPDVGTRLRCSACDTPICFDCGRSAAVGFKCPECAAHREQTTSPRATGSGALSRVRSGSSDDGPLPLALGARATAMGALAALLGGAILGPVLQAGTFFLLSAGVVGWAVARAVYWTTAERNSPYLRAIALTLAGFAVAVGLGIAGSWAGGRGAELVFLAYPAAVYGGWIVVRQR